MVKRLDQILLATGARIVISSAWKSFGDLTWWNGFLRGAGIRSRLLTQPIVVGKTRHLRGSREDEIAEWLSLADPVESFVILDDESDMGHLSDHLVKTEFSTGLQDEHVRQAIEMLGRRSV
jgi:hypothetical protein